MRFVKTCNLTAALAIMVSALFIGVLFSWWVSIVVFLFGEALAITRSDSGKQSAVNDKTSEKQKELGQLRDKEDEWYYYYYGVHHEDKD